MSGFHPGSDALACPIEGPRLPMSALSVVKEGGAKVATDAAGKPLKTKFEVIIIAGRPSENIPQLK